MTLSADYFARLYASHEDPWEFRTRWYERRKRDITISALPQRRFRRAFEPGCSIGMLTAALADRCDQLLATDINETAIGIARAELAESSNVTFERRCMPGEWPDGSFDLIVLSEIGYYLSSTDLTMLIDHAVNALNPGGTLLTCHWRHPVADYPLCGDDVHARVGEHPELVRAVRHEEEDFLLEIHTVGRTLSPGRREGLVE